MDQDLPWVLPRPLHYDQLCRLILLLGAYSAPEGAKPRKVSVKLDVTAVRRLIASAAEVLFPWPAGFRRLLTRLEDTDEPCLARRFGYFYKAMYREFSRDEAGFLHEQLEAHIQSRWPGVLSRRHRYQPEGMRQHQRYMTLARAADSCGIPAQRLRANLAAGVIPAVVLQTPLGRCRYLIQTDLLEGITEQLSCLSLQEAACIVGLPEARLSQLIAEGLLRADPPCQGAPWRIHKVELQALQAALSLCETNIPNREAKPIRYLLRHYRIASTNFAAMVRAIIARDLPATLEKSDSPIFERLRVCPAHLHERWGDSQARLTIVEAASRLGIKQEVAYFLVNTGWLEAVTDPNGVRKVSTDSLDRFSEQFVLARDLAKHWHRSARATIDYLLRQQVQPIAGPSLNGCRQVIYRRKDVDAFIENR